jgi:asparagine synthase (glutamine-hydrolysing)
MRREDMQHYLPDDILTKVDRASMRVALEARVPLLDHRVVELGWALPSELLVRDGVGKWPLRRSLYRRVPQALVDRPKMGFGVPIGDWLRGPLRAWASDLLDPAGMARQGVLDAQVVQRAWQQHQAGAENGYLLWDVLVLQMWLERNASAIG